MTDQKTKNTENQSQNESLPANSVDQAAPNIPKAEQSEQKSDNYQNTARPSEGRSFFWLSIVFDALLFLVTTVYALFAYHQWQAMSRQVEVMNRQAEVMAKQLETANRSLEQSQKMIEMAQGTSEQTERLIAHSGEQAKASTDQAKAAVIQAEAARRTVSAAQSSASAAEQTAQITKQAFYIGDRPYISAGHLYIEKFEAGVKPRIGIAFSNTGKTPALEVRAAAKVSIGDSPSPKQSTSEKYITFEPSIPALPTGSIFTLPAGESAGFFVEGNEVLTKATVEEIKNGKRFLFVFGLAFYKDGLGKPHELRYCQFYSPADDMFVACAEFNSTK